MGHRILQILYFIPENLNLLNNLIYIYDHPKIQKNQEFSKFIFYLNNIINKTTKYILNSKKLIKLNIIIKKKMNQKKSWGNFM